LIFLRSENPQGETADFYWLMFVSSQRVFIRKSFPAVTFSPPVFKIAKVRLIKLCMRWRRIRLKSFSVRLSFTDRRQGPGVGRSITTDASNLPGAVTKAVREFWRDLDTKQRNDARRSLKIEVLERDYRHLQQASPEVYRMFEKAVRS
jgi:hypothetical protein